MDKPFAYIETTVVSYLTSRSSRDLVQAARQETTNEWWDARRDAFECFVSQLVVDECSAGDPAAAERRLHALRDCRVLSVTEEAILLAEFLMKRELVPEVAADDALHIAVASVHGMRYLVTWNFKHIANAQKVEAIRSACAEMGYVCPVLCTPDELMETP